MFMGEIVFFIWFGLNYLEKIQDTHQVYFVEYSFSFVLNNIWSTLYLARLKNFKHSSLRIFQSHWDAYMCELLT